ncbi:MAG: HIT family protein [Turicibacter sp.]|nr:HIT family protein [Turicibacter sp.]
MNQCIFCKIINKEIPGQILFENEHVLAFLDISQTTKGHTLVIPKKHAEDVFSMSEEDMCHVFSVVPRLANALKTTFNADGMNIVNNNKPVAGQTVFHYHVHLIPRYSTEDSFQINYTNNMSKYTPESLATLKEEVLANL